MPSPDAVAANFVPSAEEVTALQKLLGALVCVQVRPQFAEINIGAPIRFSRGPNRERTTATIFLPLAEEATAPQYSNGASAGSQVSTCKAASSLVAEPKALVTTTE